MSLKIDRVQLEIVIKQNDAQRKLLETEEEMRKVRTQLTQLKRAHKETSAEYLEAANKLKILTQQHDALIEKIGLEGMTMQQLGRRQKELNAVMKQLPPNEKLYGQYKAQLDQVNMRIKELKGNADTTRSSLSRISSGINKYAMAVTSFIASAAGIVYTMKRNVDQYAELEEHLSNVRKYTGMARDQIDELNESFKKMDTRASREELNDLASDAGRLGIQGKQNILDFVDAANIIKVSLGEDLGQDAIKNIGKLAMMFGEDKRMGLRGAMLAVGSAINEVAQNSSASEPYLAEFLARTSGVGNQAKITSSNLMGFASVLDQNMQQVEMSSTALQGVIMKMYKDPAKMASVAGLDVKEFTKLVKTDANEALLTLLDTLGKVGGMYKLAPIFDEMKLDGARASGVLSVLAGNIDNVRQQQALATKAYNDGTSVINEYNIQNNTAQARLDKAKKGFQEVSYALGQQMYPAMIGIITSTGTLVSGLSSLVGFVIKYRATLLSLAISISVYTAAVKAKIMWDKLQVFWTGKVVTSLKALKVAIATNPWGAIVVAVAAVIALFIDFKRRSTELTQSMKSMQDIQEKTNSQFANQSGRIKALTAIMHNNKLIVDERRKAIEELNGIIPGYNAQISDEGKITRENTQALKDYLVQLQQKIMLEATKDELTELYKKRTEQMQDWRKAYSVYAKAQRDFKTTMTEQSSGGTEDLIYGATQKANQSLDKVRQKYNDILLTDKAIADVQKNIATTASNIIPAAATPVDPGEKQLTEKELKKELDKREKILTEGKNKELVILEQKKIEGSITEEQYQNMLYDIDLTYLENRKELYKKFGKDTSDIDLERLQRIEQYGNELAKNIGKIAGMPTNIPAEEDPQEDNYILEKFKASLEGKQAILEANYKNGLISQQEYEDQSTQIAQVASDDREGIIKNYLKAVNIALGIASDIINGLQEIETKKVETSYDKKIKAAKKAGKDTTKLEEEKEEAVNTVKKKYADAQFAVAVLQATSTTAVTAMEAYKALAGVPFVGPALGAAAAAAAIAAGAVQIAIAKATRDQAKGLYEGGYSKEYITGYTGSGESTEMAGVIPVHKNEFVGNHIGVQNPHVKQFYDVFDAAQKNGSIGLINTTEILRRVNYQGGKYTGGYTDDGRTMQSNARSSNATTPDTTNVMNLKSMTDLMERIAIATEFYAKYGGVTIRDVRKEIKRQENAEARASR